MKKLIEIHTRWWIASKKQNNQKLIKILAGWWIASKKQKDEADE